MTDASAAYSVPDGSHVLHIGPHKTGTTTIQAAFHASRGALETQGVRYAGPKAHSMVAAMAAGSGRDLPTVARNAGQRRWAELVEEVRGSHARVTLVSSEFYSEATGERIDRILDDLGRRETHVVITLRPLVRILPSQWQQYMQNRPALTYDDSLGYDGWLREMLTDPGSSPLTPTFWRRHRHDELVAAWVARAGVERVTVVVVDDRDHGMILRAFEDLVGVTHETLQVPGSRANRSLTMPEIDALRGLNSAWLERGWSTADYTRFVRFGAVRYLQQRQPAADEPRLLTPEWAVARAAEIGAEMNEGIRATGVRVIGDLSILEDVALAQGIGENAEGQSVPADVVARLTAGLVKLVAETPTRRAPAGRQVGDLEEALREALVARKVSPSVGSASTWTLLRTVAGRARRRIPGQ